ncbi:MAG: trypsin-like serine protease [Candidatus Limnocylindrales bacterium]
MRRLVFVIGILAALALAAAPVAAITNGHPDGNDHPEVGALVETQAYSDGTWTYCSGTLIAPTVFLTAAHCATDNGPAIVTFDTDYHAGDVTYSGTFHVDPAYPGPTADPHDVAVVVLDAPVEGIAPARLPEAGSLDKLAKGTPITSVGYGAKLVTSGPGGHGFVYDDVRREAVGSVNTTTTSWLRASMNPALGDGGTCFGDSGGPNFLGTSNIVAATTITGDSVCRATNVDYRMDSAAARAFLGEYVTLP